MVPAAVAPQTPRAPIPPTHPRGQNRNSPLPLARRFARAYLAYQIGVSSPSVLHELAATCTPTFAATLISQPVRVPPAQASAPAYQPAALDRLRYIPARAEGPALILVGYHTISDPAVGGTLRLAVEDTARGWRVAGVS